MENEAKGCTRRDFFKVTGAVGAGAILGPMAVAHAGSQAHDAARLLAAGDAKLPTRPFGRSGVQVPILCLGGMFDTGANQLMLRQALR